MLSYMTVLLIENRLSGKVCCVTYHFPLAEYIRGRKYPWLLWKYRRISKNHRHLTQVGIQLPPLRLAVLSNPWKSLPLPKGKRKAFTWAFLIAVKGMQKMNFGWEKRTLSEVSASLAAEKREESFASITRFWTESNGKGILSKRISMTNGSRISKKGSSVWAIRFIYANPIIATP